MLTLKSVFEKLIKESYKCKGVFLSFWKFNSGTITSNWFISEEKFSLKRIELENKNHIDTLDMINVL